MRNLLTSTLLFALFGLLSSVPVSAAQLGVGDPDSIPPGFDLLQTLPGTLFFVRGVPVPMHGIPDAMGADTIIQRLSEISIPDVIGATQTINTQMTQLNLMSDPGAGPGGSTVFINLTPGVPTLGVLTLTQTIDGEGIPEGTFSSFFDVFLDVRLFAGTDPISCVAGGTVVLVCHDELTLTGSGLWTDDIPGQLFVGHVVHEIPGGGVLISQEFVTPEPGTEVLFGTGIVLGALSLKWRLRR